MRISILSALVAIAPCALGTAAFAQGAQPSHSEVHRSVTALEAELLSIIDRKEELTAATEKRNAAINELIVERNRAPAAERDRFNQRIEANNNQNRAAAIETARLNFASERVRIEIDRLMRYDDHLDSKGKGRAPGIRSISVIKRDRKGPVQVPGRGRGFHETTLYEVIFADGSRQRVESTGFVPQR